jgi:hypothetical protein
MEDLPAIYDSAINITGALSISLEPSDEIKGIEIFPNPVNEIVYVQNNGDSGPVKFRLTDCNGKLVSSGNIHQGSTEAIAVNQYPKGLYLMRIENSGRQFRSAKIIIK